MRGFVCGCSMLRVCLFLLGRAYLFAALILTRGYSLHSYSTTQMARASVCCTHVFFCFVLPLLLACLPRVLQCFENRKSNPNCIHSEQGRAAARSRIKHCWDVGFLKVRAWRLAWQRSGGSCSCSPPSLCSVFARPLLMCCCCWLHSSTFHFLSPKPHHHHPPFTLLSDITGANALLNVFFFRSLSLSLSLS